MLEYEICYILMAKIFPLHKRDPTALLSTQAHISIVVVVNLILVFFFSGGAVSRLEASLQPRSYSTACLRRLTVKRAL